jgi:GPH family glycoside/pentoside/hexuronide:cation symporter
MKKNENYETSAGVKAVYYSYFLGQNMLYFIVNQYAMLYFTDYVGITAKVVGTIFLAARIWDAVDDPMFGVIVDKCNMKGGKYKPWINFVAFGLPIVSFLLFCIPNISMAGKITFAAVIYVLWGMTYTVSDVPGFAIATVMTKNINERNEMLATSRLFAVLGLMLVSLTIIPLSERFGWTGAALIIAMVAMVFMNLQRRKVAEKYKAKEENVTLKKILSCLFHNKYLLIYYLCITLWLATSTSTLTLDYFTKYNLGDSSLVGVLMAAAVLPMMADALLVQKLIKKFGKNKVMVGACVFYMLVLLAFYFCGYSSFPAVVFFMILIGLSQGIFNVMYPMYTADCIEYGTWKSGERATGISFSVQTFTTKLGQAIASAVVGFTLDGAGFIPNAVQSSKALSGIFSMMTLIPCAGVLAMMLVFIFCYKLKDSDIVRFTEENTARETKKSETEAE